MAWYEQSNRPLPWKGIKNPYLIWLSEIILQQTRTEQGKPYYERFKEKYPTIHKMAEATEDEIMKLWQGLGYYSRARNMHFTANYISKELAGKFPTTLKELQNLKGVGPYTAAAIASFAFDQPHAVVDGNVYRVLSRFFGIKTAIDTPDGRQLFDKLARQLLDPEQAGRYNQAIMDLGATVCSSKAYKCEICFLSKNCVAFSKGIIETLPVKSKKIKKRIRYFNYFLLNFNGRLLIQKRTAKDIWQNLYEFPLLESKHPLRDIRELTDSQLWVKLVGTNKNYHINLLYCQQQQLTHQKIYGNFWQVTLPEIPNNCSEFNWVDVENLSKFAFPRIITLFLEDKSLNLG